MTDGTLNIGPGDVVSGLEPDELVEIQRVAPFGSKKLLEGVPGKWLNQRARRLDSFISG